VGIEDHSVFQNFPLETRELFVEGNINVVINSRVIKSYQDSTKY
jgi:hypothetical protein